MKKEKNLSGKKQDMATKKSGAKTPAKSKKSALPVKNIQRPKSVGLQNRTVVNYNDGSDA